MNIIERIDIAFRAAKFPVRIWLAPIDHAKIHAEAYRQSGGKMIEVRIIENLPVARDPFGQPSRMISSDGTAIKF